MNKKVLEWIQRRLHILRLRTLGKSAEELAWESLKRIVPDAASPQALADAIIASLEEAEVALRHAETQTQTIRAMMEGSFIATLLLDRYGPDHSLWQVLQESGIVQPGHAHTALGVREAQSYLQSPTVQASLELDRIHQSV